MCTGFMEKKRSFVALASKSWTAELIIKSTHCDFRYSRKSVWQRVIITETIGALHEGDETELLGDGDPR